MSRVGKALIKLPQGVEVKVSGQNVDVKGPKGVLSREVHHTMDVVVDADGVKVTPKAGDGQHTNFHGLTRSLVNNMVIGVSEGFTKRLKLVGVGYRAAMAGADLQLTLGYSHPVLFKVPKGLDVSVDKQTTVIVTGADKEMVGQAAANIRAYRKPEPYHGKGVRYEDERIVTKVGKSAGKK